MSDHEDPPEGGDSLTRYLVMTRDKVPRDGYAYRNRRFAEADADAIGGYLIRLDPTETVADFRSEYRPVPGFPGMEISSAGTIRPVLIEPHKHVGPKDRACEQCGKGYWAMQNMRMVHTDAQ